MAAYRRNEPATDGSSFLNLNNDKSHRQRRWTITGSQWSLSALFTLQTSISDLKSSRNDLGNIRQMPHDVGGQLNERTLTSFQINSLNSQMKFFFHKMLIVHISVTCWLVNVKEGSDRGKRKAHELWVYWAVLDGLCVWGVGRFWTVFAYKGLGGFGMSAQ